MIFKLKSNYRVIHGVEIKQYFTACLQVNSMNLKPQYKSQCYRVKNPKAMDHTQATHLNILKRLRIKTHKLMNLLLARTIVKITPQKIYYFYLFLIAFLPRVFSTFILYIKVYFKFFQPQTVFLQPNIINITMILLFFNPRQCLHYLIIERLKSLPNVTGCTCRIQ